MRPPCCWSQKINANLYWIPTSIKLVPNNCMKAENGLLKSKVHKIDFDYISSSLRIEPFLLASRCWGRFARRNVCASATKIPYWWREFCLESGQELWLVILLIGSNIVLPIVYEWQTKDKRPERSNVNRVVNVINLLQGSQYSWNIFFFRKKHLSFTGACRSRTQNFTIIDKEIHIIKQICIWNPMTTGFTDVNIDSRHQYGISVA